MLIRNATLSDAPVMAEIFDRLHVNRRGNLGSGFVENPLTVEEYRRRIKDNPLAFVAEFEKPVGFALGYTSDFLRKLVYTDDRASSDKLALCALGLEPPFTYLDLIAVLDEYQEHGVGSALDTAFVDKTLNLGIPRSCGVMRKTHKKTIEYYVNRGSEFVCDVRNQEGLEFEMHMRDHEKIRRLKSFS